MPTAAQPSPKPLLTLRGVTVPRVAEPTEASLEAVNWSVAAGEVWVVAGLHGGGKTDLLHCAAGLTLPLAGTCEVAGHPMPMAADADLPTRLKLGLVFAGGNLLHDLNLAENIALPLRYHRNLAPAEAAARVTPLIEALGLASQAGRMPEALSRHAQRRAGLGRALILEPDLLLLDDPLIGLDARQRAWWLAVLGRLAGGHSPLRARPVTLVVTTQHLRAWRRVGTRFALVHERRFTELGGWRDAAASADPVVRELLAAADPDED